MLIIFLLSLGLILLPLVYWPTAPVPFEIPRVWFIERWVEIMVILGLIMILIGKENKKTIKFDKVLTLSILGFILSATVSSILGVDFTKSFWGNYYRGDGLVTLFHLAVFSLLFSLFWREKLKNYVALAISIGASFTGLWAVTDGIKFYIFNDYFVQHWVDGAIGVSFGQPKFLAGYLLVSMPFTIYLIKLAKSVPQRIFFVVSIIVQTIALSMTKSWAGILGIGLLITFIIFFCTKFNKMILIFFGSLFIIITLFVVDLRVYKDKGFVAEGRERIFRKVLLASKVRPILGWGWANVDYAFEKVDWPIHIDHDVYVDKAHSTILEVFATTGIVGLIFYVFILVLTGQRLIRFLRLKSKDYFWYETFFLVFILYLFHSQTNVISIAEELIFWLIIGIISSTSYCNLTSQSSHFVATQFSQ